MPTEASNKPYYRSAEYFREWRRKNRLKARAIQKKYRANHPEKLKTSNSIRKAANRDVRQLHVNRVRKINPIKVRAQEKARYHVKAGNIKKLPCKCCSDTNTHAHHSDYHKPLDIVWLCPKHHVAWHRLFIAEGDFLLE